MRRIGISAAVLVIVFLFASALRAQTSTGALRGIVQDETGARVAGARIDLTLAGVPLMHSIKSDKHGEFRIDDLRPGAYRVAVTAEGFSVAVADVLVAISSIRDISVTMKPSSVRQAVGVQGTGSSIATQPIDHASNVHQSIITSHELETLPLAARSFANVAYLAPGTEPVEPSDPTKARITAVSTGGSSGLNNELSVDGGDDSDDYIGGFLQNISPEAIQEFSVRTSQEDADTGGTTAGSVAITTRSGTDVWHGSAAGYERAAALNARYPIDNPAPNPKQPFSRQNYVATLGGPVSKLKVWFFSTFEYVREDASISYSPANLTEFDALASLASQGLIPGVSSIAVPSNVQIPFRDQLGSLRLDWEQSPASSWYLRGSVDSYTTHNDLVEQGTLPCTGLLTHNNYLNLTASNRFVFTPALLGSLVFSAGGLHLTQTRNSHLGFALAFPFSSTALTISGFETFGDNQFATPITYFPSERNQEKYQFRYDLSSERPQHALGIGVNLIHEPVLGGAFPDTRETLYSFPQNPTYYLGNPQQLITDMMAGASTSQPGGSFAQNVQRLALYAQDSWRLTPNLTLNYGLRYSTTFGLFTASGRTQAANPGYITLQVLHIPLVGRPPTDDRRQIAPRLGVVYSPGRAGNTVLRAGFGLYFNDLAQTGWATAFQAVNQAPGPCVDPIRNLSGAENRGCVQGSAAGGAANLIAPNYRTPYAIHFSAGVVRSFGANWALSADYVHEQGNHGYRAYSYSGGANLFTPLLPLDSPEQALDVPDVHVFHSDNRSSYNAAMVHLQGNVSARLSMVANYTLSKAQTWGCVLGELFDYVNGVCDPLHPFSPGDYGPSGEDVRHRLVLAGELKPPGGTEVTFLTQEESARPFTISTADNSRRITINGIPTSLDQFRGTPYLQTDLRISRPVSIRDRWKVIPFAEFFNLFNRNNPGGNYVTNIANLPVPGDQILSGNVTDICLNAGCTRTTPVSGLNGLRVPGGAFGDFFGPGTTVGIPFAAQLGWRVEF